MRVDDLLDWYGSAKRDLPWRRTSDPYAIWISEVMSQQTRIDTVIPYYERFLTRFPDVCSLANASQEDVLKIWEGLGYYSRGRNLHHAAKQICHEHDGVLPSEYDAFRALKGVGPYTAAAVLSIAYNKPFAVLDGNVMRVISRVMGMSEDIRLSSTRANLQRIADEWIPTSHPADFNQAIMELGSTVCTPRKPLCGSCPVSQNCMAYASGDPEQFPYKSPKAAVPHHHIVVGILVDADGHVLIARRPDEVMLGGLWEFPGGKVEAGETDEAAIQRELAEELGVQIGEIRHFHTLKHAYSHFKITMNAYMAKIVDGIPNPLSSNELKWVSIDQLSDYPFPKANRTLTQALQHERP